MSANLNLKQFNPYLTSKDILKLLSNKRTRDVLLRRFGVGKKQGETLEAIGRDYGISRERVRQIENDGLAILSKKEILNQFKPALAIVSHYLNQYSSLRREDLLLGDLTNHFGAKSYQHQGALRFLLTLGRDFYFHPEDNDHYNFWAEGEKVAHRAISVVENLVNLLKSKKQALDEKGMMVLGRQVAASKNLSNKAMLAMIEISRKIEKNNFGDYGLVGWSEITPKGVKDKAYSVFRKGQKPLHFRKVAELINLANFTDRRLAHPQTVHNELIKDPRFVLVGRGLYALREWGYESGTVRDLIMNLLKNSGSLHKEAIVQSVMAQRKVRENTILVNLQNRKYFVRNEKGVYNIKGA